MKKKILIAYIQKRKLCWWDEIGLVYDDGSNGLITFRVYDENIEYVKQHIYELVGLTYKEAANICFNTWPDPVRERRL